jgi:hypothetical protein
MRTGYGDIAIERPDNHADAEKCSDRLCGGVRCLVGGISGLHLELRARERFRKFPGYRGLNIYVLVIL